MSTSKKKPTGKAQQWNFGSCWGNSKKMSKKMAKFCGDSKEIHNRMEMMMEKCGLSPGKPDKEG